MANSTRASADAVLTRMLGASDKTSNNPLLRDLMIDQLMQDPKFQALKTKGKIKNYFYDSNKNITAEYKNALTQSLKTLYAKDGVTADSYQSADAFDTAVTKTITPILADTGIKEQVILDIQNNKNVKQRLENVDLALIAIRQAYDKYDANDPETVFLLNTAKAQLNDSIINLNKVVDKEGTFARNKAVYNSARRALDLPNYQNLSTDQRNAIAIAITKECKDHPELVAGTLQDSNLMDKAVNYYLNDPEGKQSIDAIIKAKEDGRNLRQSWDLTTSVAGRTVSGAAGTLGTFFAKSAKEYPLWTGIGTFVGLFAAGKLGQSLFNMVKDPKKIGGFLGSGLFMGAIGLGAAALVIKAGGGKITDTINNFLPNNPHSGSGSTDINQNIAAIAGRGGSIPSPLISSGTGRSAPINWRKRSVTSYFDDAFKVEPAAAQ